MNLHLPELPLPPVEADLREVVFPTDIQDRLATVHCSEDPNLVFRGIYRLPFILGPFSILQTNTTGGSKKSEVISVTSQEKEMDKAEQEGAAE